MTQILNSRELWNSNEIAAINADIGLPFDLLTELTRAIEQAVIAKLREQKPVAWKDTTFTSDENEAMTSEPVLLGYEGWESLPDGTELFIHPAPSAPKSPFTAGEDNDGWYVEFEGDQIAYGLTEEKANHIVSNYNAPSAPEGWQPIESVPKDSTHVLTYCPKFGVRETVGSLAAQPQGDSGWIPIAWKLSVQSSAEVINDLAAARSE